DALSAVRTPETMPRTKAYHDERAAALLRDEQANTAADPFAAALHEVRTANDPTDHRSAFARGVDTLSTPLVPQIAKWSKAVADKLASPSLSQAEAMQTARGPAAVGRAVPGLIGGLVEGAGNVVSSFTS